MRVVSTFRVGAARWRMAACPGHGDGSREPGNDAHRAYFAADAGTAAGLTFS